MKQLLTFALLLVASNLFAQFPSISDKGGTININEYITATSLGYTSSYGSSISIFGAWEDDWSGPESYLKVYASLPQDNPVAPSQYKQVGETSSYDWGWFSCSCQSVYEDSLRVLTISDVGKYIFIKYHFDDGTTVSSDVITMVQIGFTTDKISVYESILNSNLSNTNQGYYVVTDVENISDTGTINVFQGGNYYLDLGNGSDTTFTNKFVWGTIAFNQTKSLCDYGIVAGKRNLNSFVFKFEDAYCYTTNLSHNGYYNLFSIIKVSAPSPYTFYYSFSGVKITVDR